MKSLRTRLTLWGALGFAAVAIAFTYILHLVLESELLEKACNRTYPEMPDWRLHNSLTEAEVHQISDAVLNTALLWLIPVMFVAVAGGFWLARQSLRPIASVNRQLQAKNPGNLGEPISLPEVDLEFRDLLRQLNDLLARLDASFAEMNAYAAKVAHELRTPLAIIRLKVEQAGERIAPELAEELEGELHRLTHVIDQSLLIARAEHGHMLAARSVFNLTATITEVVEDFQLLADEEGRQFKLQSIPDCWVSADPRHIRQIAHSLLTNALKHGEGDFTVRIRRHRRQAVLIVTNRVRQSANAEPTLGLGLRVVAALLRLEPEIRFHRRLGKNYHVARLLLPLVEQPQSFHI